MTEETRVSMDSDMQTSSNNPSIQGSIPRIKIDLKDKFDPEAIEKEKADLAVDWLQFVISCSQKYSGRTRLCTHNKCAR